ncbi:MAG: HisA/HisF-related TIM barrel protein, partial [Nanoarchaeota archaeon]|nr:HisA/HisF-related TIM barrel protein [Nanoarchaeota archaeon]
GGISAIEDMKVLLRAGADKVAITTAAVETPLLISKAAKIFGSQCIVVGIDAKKEGSGWSVYTRSGKKRTELNVVDWAKTVQRLGAGEILLTCIDKDGTKGGYDLELTKAVSEAVSIPVIASGGAKDPETIFRVLKEGKADAALAASIFHTSEYSIQQVKQYLKERNVKVRQ